MADKTENLALSYLVGGQAQKHITHNEALLMLDALVQLTVVTRTLGSPPSDPAAGARYIVSTPALGEWAGKAGQIAAFQRGGWAFYPPGTGWLAYIEAEGIYLRFAGAAWQSLAAPEETARLGINTSADSTNRLAIASPAALFTHDGDDHRLTINKATPPDTASVVFSVGYSGRAEMGLVGSNLFCLKVSADGTTWREAMLIDPTTGEVSFPGGVAS